MVLDVATNADPSRALKRSQSPVSRWMSSPH